MNPILFEHDDAIFEDFFGAETSNGLGRLTKVTRCSVQEELQGIYELEIECPIEDKHYKDVQLSRQVVVKVSNGSLQPFRINYISRPIDGKVTIHGYHRSYDLSRVTVMPAGVASRTPVQMWNWAAAHHYGDILFDFYTDIADTKGFPLDRPVTLRALLGGEDPSFSYVYGGEFEWDKFTVRFLQRRGSDNSVSVRYAKNMTDITAVMEATPYNTIVPYANGNDQQTIYAPGGAVFVGGNEPYMDGDQLILNNPAAYKLTGDQIIINSAGAQLVDDQLVFKTVSFGAVPVDVSSLIETEDNPTPQQVAAAGERWMRENQPWATIKELSVSFVHASENTDPLQRVLLGDTVSVVHADLGVEEDLRVVKTVWNVLTERYDSIELGTPARLISKAMDSWQKQTQRGIEEAKGLTKDVANGNFGGGTFIDEDKIKAPTLQENDDGDLPALDGVLEVHDSDGGDTGATMGEADGGVAMVYDGDPAALTDSDTYVLANGTEVRLRRGGKTIVLDDDGIRAESGSSKKIVIADNADSEEIRIEYGDKKAIISADEIRLESGSDATVFSSTDEETRITFGEHSIYVNEDGCFADDVQIGVAEEEGA